MTSHRPRPIDRTLDAAARDRAEKIALAVDDEMRTDRARGRAPGLDHGGERDAAPGFGQASAVARMSVSVLIMMASS
jgi:hypothetical protein